MHLLLLHMELASDGDTSFVDNWSVQSWHIVPSGRPPQNRVSVEPSPLGQQILAPYLPVNDPTSVLVPLYLQTPSGQSAFSLQRVNSTGGDGAGLLGCVVGDGVG